MVYLRARDDVPAKVLLKTAQTCVLVRDSVYGQSKEKTTLKKQLTRKRKTKKKAITKRKRER